jgi:hypothetical protein
VLHDGTEDGGLDVLPLVASLLVTEMKSEPRNTPVTPSTPNRRCASGEAVASDLSRKSTVPSPSTVLPGMNLSVAGLGVGSVWMNMGRAFRGPISLNLESF